MLPESTCLHVLKFEYVYLYITPKTYLIDEFNIGGSRNSPDYPKQPNKRHSKGMLTTSSKKLYQGTCPLGPESKG